MTKAPIIPEIQWHEGMLLSPQHFQQMELRNQQLLRYHLHRLSPFHWGVQHLKLDPVVLTSGLFRLLEIEAVMPDGLIVHRQSDTDPPLELDLTPFKEDLSKEALTLYLAVPQRTLTSSPVTGEWPRYLSVDGPEVTDDNSPDNVVRIPRLLPKISLLAGSVPPARYESLPLARIAYQGEAYILTPYLPPCFLVSRGSSLGERCASLALKMREKASYLTEKWQNQGGSELLRDTTELLRPLAESLPLLEAVVTTGKTHPYDLYLTLCALAGRLTTLRLGQVIPSFPSYHHDEILKSLEPILSWMEQVTSGIERTYRVLPFQQNDRLFHHKLPRADLGDSLLIGVRVPPIMDGREMAEWVRECVIASESHLETARLRRVTGAPREVIEGEELADLLPNSGLQLYRIQMDPHYIKPGENLIIFHAADQMDKRPAGIVLYLKGPHPLSDEAPEQEG